MGGTKIFLDGGGTGLDGGGRPFMGYGPPHPPPMLGTPGYWWKMADNGIGIGLNLRLGIGICMNFGYRYEFWVSV